MTGVLGIDEAGRGCVLGALYVAGYYVAVEDEARLRAAGAADSKALSPKRRDAARAALAALGQADVRAIPATAIDGGNLNALEEAVIADLVRTWQPASVRMDALGPPSGVARLIARLEAQLPPSLRPTWVIEPKADATFAVVGAASVFAKTTRDADLAALDPRWGPLGSGYPSDPTTRRWLAARAQTGAPWPDFVRTRWGTVVDLTAG